MHFVAALDDAPGMRAVLTLFEGVATGAADGFARMADRPAATLLHLGPGLGNGLANLHNARRAASPVVNIVGDHATHHAQLRRAPAVRHRDRRAQRLTRLDPDPDHGRQTSPLTLRRPSLRRSGPPGQVATLIVPADASWSEGATPAPPVAPAYTDRRSTRSRSQRSPRALGTGEPDGACSLGGRPARGRPAGGAAGSQRQRAPRCSQRCSPPGSHAGPASRRGARPLPPRVRHEQLGRFDHLVLVDADRPLSFFAYPDSRSDLVPDSCRVDVLADGHHDVLATLAALADAAAVAGSRAAPASRRHDRRCPAAR